MADTTTELEVLDQIVDVLGGQSGQYETVVPVLQQIKELLASGGAIADGAVTTSKLADNAVTMGKLSQDVQDAIEEGGSGYNPSLSVGRADALTGVDSTAQWAQRTTEGSGSATVRSVQGAAVVWNQMRDVGGFVRDVSRVIAGHVYYFSGISAADADVPSGGYIRWRLYTMSNGEAKTLATLQFTESGAHKVATRFTSSYNAVSDGTGDNTEGNLWTYRDVVGGASGALGDMMLIDLTTMFGSGNEPATVAEFEQMYPESYYPYSAPILKPVQISGIRSTDAQGNALDGVEWTVQTLRAAGSVRDELYSDHVDVNVGVVDLGTLTWTAGSDSVRQVFFANIPDLKYVTDNVVVNATCPGYVAITKVAWSATDINTDNVMRSDNSAPILYFRNMSYTTAADFKAAMSGVLLYYELATPTTQPISPALPMTYKVQAGGSESIIVPSGEISAIPVLTVAEGESVADVVMDALACIAAPDGPTATANHSVGTYLTMQGKLYKVTSAIAVGESIVAGTNVTQTTVMAELLALTA